MGKSCGYKAILINVYMRACAFTHNMYTVYPLHNTSTLAKVYNNEKLNYDYTSVCLKAFDYLGEDNVESAL